MWYMFLQVWDVFASHIYICIKFQVITRQLQQIEESYPLYQHPLYLFAIIRQRLYLSFLTMIGVTIIFKITKRIIRQECTPVGCILPALYRTWGLSVRKTSPGRNMGPGSKTGSYTIQRPLPPQTE